MADPAKQIGDGVARQHLPADGLARVEAL